MSMDVESTYYATSMPNFEKFVNWVFCLSLILLAHRWAVEIIKKAANPGSLHKIADYPD